MSAAMQIRRRQPDWSVTVLESGRFTSYAACGIPYLIAGDVDLLDSLVVVSPEEFRTRRGVDVRTDWEATAVDTGERRVTARTPDGEETLGYDRLLLATGAEAILPRWPGAELEGVTPLRNLVDAQRVLEQLRGAARVAIIGAGYVGLEMAEAFGRRDLEVTVIEKQPGVMGGVTCARSLRTPAASTWTSRSSRWACARGRRWRRPPASPSATRAPFAWTSTSAPASRRCSPRATAPKPGTACSNDRRTCRWPWAPTARAASPAPTWLGMRSASPVSSAVP
jgi:glycine/D-amino acid oxidase-like deaminating enzyme